MVLRPATRVGFYLLAPLHLVYTLHVAGAAASVAETCKIAKYSALSPSLHFMPVAIETMGVWDPGAIEFLRNLGGRLAIQLGELQVFSHLRQGLNKAIQIGNAISVLGTFPVSLTRTVCSFHLDRRK